MRICLIGDSHAAMLIAAHRQDPQGEALTVFAKPGLSVADIAIEGPVLRAVSDDLRSRLDGMGTPHVLDLSEFDALLIAGLAPSAFAAVRLQQGHHVSGWPSGARAVSRALTATGTPGARPLLTRAAYRASLRSLTQGALSTRIAEAARAPVRIVPQPFPSDAILQGEGKYPVFRRVVRNGDGTALAQDLTQAHKTVLGAIPGTACIAQPTETLSHGCLTRAEFMRGGPRLAEGGRQQADDVLHGNALLGARLLTCIRRSLSAPIESASNP